MSAVKNVDAAAPGPKTDYHFAWVIKHFRNLHSRVGSWHASPKFFTGSDYEWFLKVFVAGYDDATSDHVDVQACLMKKQTYRKLKLMIECSILGRSGKRQSRTTTLVTEKVPRKARVTFRRFIPRHELLNRFDLLPNGELRIACQISLNDFGPTDEIDPTENPLDDYKKLMDNDKFSDFTLVVGNAEFKVHRAILGKSPVFKTIFDNNTPGSSEMIVRIDDIVPEVMKRLLRFIYVGQTDIKGFAGEVLVAAEKYQLYALKQLCESELATKLSVDNVYNVLRLAEQYDASVLKKHAMEFFSRNLKKLKETENFKISVTLLPVNIQTDIICALANQF